MRLLFKYKFFFLETEEEPFVDSGSEYVPSNNESETGNLSKDEIENATTVQIGENNNEENKLMKKEQKRKRIRNKHTWKKNIKKTKKCKGESYLSTTGKQVPAKIFDQVICSCKNICHQHVNFERQQQIFTNFYNLQTYDLQSAYLFSQIKVVNKSRSYTKNTESRRQKN